MSRQSGRLQSMGYYDEEAERSLYKEIPFRNLTRRKRKGSRRLSGGSNASSMGPAPEWGEKISIEEVNSHLENPATETRETLPVHQQAPCTPRRKRFSRETAVGLFYILLMFIGGSLYTVYASSGSDIMGGSEKHLRMMQAQLAKLQEDMAGSDGKRMQQQLEMLQGEMSRLRNKLLPLADTMPNFALESQGATISQHLSSETYHTRHPLITFWGIPLWYPPANPRTIIQGHSSPLTPGQCWAFGGRRGHVFISLSHPITINHVTLGHISSTQSPAGFPYSAPREFSVYGMDTVDGEGTRLGTFVYDPNGESLQTFKLPGHTKGVYRFVKLRIESNWGHPEYTCVYNFRVHGKVSQNPVTA